MSRANRYAVSLLLLVASASLLGCLHRPGPRSAYQAFYQNQIAGVRLPTYEEIASVDDSLLEPFDQPAPKIWDACLGFAAQSRGVLAAADDASGGHRLLLISGETWGYKRDQQAFVDRWLVISVLPIAESSTEVRVAFVSPRTALVAPFSDDKLSDGFKGDKQRSISRRTAERFILALKKTFLENEYLTRFGGVARPTPRGVPRNVEIKQTERGESVAQQRGNHNSATIRREGLVLNVPRLEERIAGVIHNIALAASQPKQETEIFIVAEDVPNFQIEPNGDLFITTSALDQIKDTDELAGILSHELAHIYLNHGSMRIGAFRRAGASRNTIAFAFILGGAALGVLSSIPDSASPEDTLLTNQEVLVGAAVSLAAYYYLPNQLGTGVGKGVGGFTIHRFTRKQELEADEYGAELLWAAGYNYRGLLNLIRSQGDSKLFEAKGERRP